MGPPKRGVRNYDVQGDTQRSLCAALGIDLPSNLRGSRTRLHVYLCPWDVKDVSPLLQDGIFTLGICGARCRQAAATDVVRLRCVITLARGSADVSGSKPLVVKTAFLVGSVLTARQYHSSGILGARLTPRR